MSHHIKVTINQPPSDEPKTCKRCGGVDFYGSQCMECKGISRLKPISDAIRNASNRRRWSDGREGG